jgi:hypothetical protein
MKKLKCFLILSQLFFVVGCDKVCLNEKEKLSLATELVSGKMYEVVDQKYDGGNNVQYQIQQIDYDCLKTEINVKTRLTFEGQFSGIQYWSVGIFSMDIANRTWVFKEISTDPLLKTAINLSEQTKREILKNFE